MLQAGVQSWHQAPVRRGNDHKARIAPGVPSGAILALVVYEKLGLALLRQAWFNLDLLWGVGLLVAGVLALVL